MSWDEQNYGGGYGRSNYGGGYSNRSQNNAYGGSGYSGGYNRGNTRNNYSSNGGGNYRSQGPKKKQNGCKVLNAQNGNSYITGWCNDKYKGFIKILVYKVEKSEEVHTSKSGRDWCSVRAKVTFANGSSQVFNALLDVQANRVKIKDLNYILSPSKNYCGPSFTKK